MGGGMAVEVRLFTYGTLRRKRRLEALAGQALPDPEPAVLEGFRRYDTGLGYPVILPEAGARVEGLVYRVPASALPAVDEYEGTGKQPPHYFRRRATALVAGREVEVEVYVGNPEVYRELRPDAG